MKIGWGNWNACHLGAAEMLRQWNGGSLGFEQAPREKGDFNRGLHKVGVEAGRLIHEDEALIRGILGCWRCDWALGFDGVAESPLPLCDAV